MAGSARIAFCCAAIATGWAFQFASAMDFVGVRNNEFVVCNQPLRFVGFNLRGICHYGYHDALPDAQAADVATNLDYCVAAGGRVIRVFCAYRFINPTETGNRLQKLLDACQQRGIYVMVAFTDMYDGPNLFPQGDIAYYTDGLLNHTFFTSGYRVNYLPQVLYLVNRFRSHPAVFCWQLGNEIRDLGSPSTSVAFFQDVARQIRAIDANHMISTGVIGWQNTGLSFSQAQQLYADFDFVNSHNYNGADTADDVLAVAINKPYVVDEAGYDCTEYGYHRAGYADAELTKLVGRSARGYLQWGLMATLFDNGDGDQIFGVDRQNHAADFVEYRDLFKQWSITLTPPPPPPGLAVQPPSLAPTLIADTEGTDTFDVFNTGAEGLEFAVSTASLPTWLSLSPTAGTVGCTPVPLTCTYRAAGMSAGAYTATIQIEAAGLAANAATVNVTLTVLDHPGDMDGDGDVDQEDFGRLQICLSGLGIAQDTPSCRSARMDADMDVDDDDVALFRRCFSRPGTRSDPLCLNR